MFFVDDFSSITISTLTFFLIARIPNKSIRFFFAFEMRNVAAREGLAQTRGSVSKIRVETRRTIK